MLEQIEKIKENTHKVYRSGQLSVFSDNECLQGKVSGRVVSMSDVAPIEHNVGVKLASKNLFDVNNATLINGYIAGDNTINMTTLTRSVVIECKPNTTYTVSKVLSARFSLGYTAEFPKQDTPCVQSGGTSQVTEKTITTDSTAKYLVVYCYHSNYDTDISVEDILNTLQIEQGTTATKHTPYIDDFSNITLTRAENIGKYVFTGEEAFYLAGSGFPYGIYIHSNGYVTDNDTTSNIKMWCTHFECVHNSEIDNENATFTFCQYSKNWYFNYDCQKGGVANFKEWLRQNYKNGTPVTVYYRKVDTTDEDFTDYTANADGTVEGVKSISPNMTLIPNNNAVSVECEYLRDIDLYIDNLITGIALTGGN